MLFRTLGVMGKRFAQRFLPSKIAGLQLWLDATDTDTLNSKMGADFVSANSEYLSSASTDFDKGNEDFSFGCWFKFDSSGVADSIVGKWGNSSNERSYLLQKAGTDKMYLFVSNDGVSSSSVLYDVALSINTWYFVVGVHDSINDLIKISVNGNTFVTTSHSTGIHTSTTDLMIGRVESGVYLDGKIDGSFFYDKALTQAQVTSLYNSANGKSYLDLTSDDLTSLVSWYELNETSGTRFDEHASNDLTDNNTVGYALGKIQEPIANGNYVWRWTDKSENAYNFDQDTASSQPEYLSSGFGTENKPYIDFDGVDDFLQTNSSVIDLTKDFTIFIVGQSDAITSDGALFSTITTNTGILYRFTTNTNMSLYVQGGNVFATGIDHNTTMLHTITLDRTVNETDNYINNETYPTDTVGAGTTHQANLAIGANGNGSLNFEGKIVEMIYYDSKLSANQQTQMQDYLNNKYGIY